MDPSGTRLYVIDGANSMIYVYAIDSSTGALTQLSGTTTTSHFATSAASIPLATSSTSGTSTLLTATH